MVDDLELLGRWREGDDAAGEALIRAHYTAVFGQIRAKVNGDSDLAAELTQRVFEVLLPRVWGLIELSAKANINLTIDAEEVDRLELSLDVFEALAQRVKQHCPQWRGFGLAIQAYQTRALHVIEEVSRIGRELGLRFMMRLVKGAYWDGEIKRAQEMGLPAYPVFTHKHHTDISYLSCAKALIDASDVIYPQFATHNAGTISAILQMARAKGAKFEMQRLHGMGEGVYREVLKDRELLCRVYAPVGEHRDLLAYLVRRLLENGANSSFVHQLADESVGMNELLISPLRLEGEGSLPLPLDMFGSVRKNSAGRDLADASMRAALLALPLLNALLPGALLRGGYRRSGATDIVYLSSTAREPSRSADTPRACSMAARSARSRVW